MRSKEWLSVNKKELFENQSRHLLGNIWTSNKFFRLVSITSVSLILGVWFNELCIWHLQWSKSRLVDENFDFWQSLFTKQVYIIASITMMKSKYLSIFQQNATFFFISDINKNLLFIKLEKLYGDSAGRSRTFEESFRLGSHTSTVFFFCMVHVYKCLGDVVRRLHTERYIAF